MNDLVKYAFSAIKDDNSTIDLNEVFVEVLDDLELLIQESQAEINYNTLPVIKGSKVQMRQLFSNLIANAIKYSKEGLNPKITLFSEKIDGKFIKMPEESYYKITLTDNGIGMNPEHLGKIFTIFQRLHMRNEYSGNGIGLAICKKIMENHSGRIDVQSSPDGSIFSLYLPISPKK